MTTQTFGQRLRELREERRYSLRKLARKLAISAPHLVDLEKDRRSPSPELLQRIADVLDVPTSVFDQHSVTLPKAVRDWLAENPVFERTLHLLARFGDPDEALSTIERAATTAPSHRFPLAIFESELQAIAQDTASWDSETGGDLFGVWADIPIVYLATRSGPNAIRNHARFRLDVDYLIKLSIQLEKDWGLRYFGDWHSHHRLGLRTPSAGDRARIQSVAEKNAFRGMAEFITTYSSPATDREIEVHPYAYLRLPSDQITDIVPIVLAGASPVREALIRQGGLPEQQFASYSSFSMDRVAIPHEPLPRIASPVGPVVEPITDRVVRRAAAELEATTSNSVEIHDTAFGYILVAHTTDNHDIAIAVDGSWPHPVLQVDWMNRNAGTSEELRIDISSTSLLDASRLVDVCTAATNCIRASSDQ